MMLIEQRRDRIRPRYHQFQEISEESIDKIGLLRINSRNAHGSSFELVLSKQDVADLAQHFPELRANLSPS